MPNANAAAQPAHAAVGESVWTPEVEARALRLFLIEGFSASDVALALGAGLTRAAVISKVRRLGFRKRQQGGGLDVLRAAPRKAPADPAPKARVERRLPPQRPPQPLPPLCEVAATGIPVILAQLPDHACRWPIDDPGSGEMHRTLFCAGPARGHPYCAAHRALSGRRFVVVAP